MYLGGLLASSGASQAARNHSFTFKPATYVNNNYHSLLAEVVAEIAPFLNQLILKP